MAAPTRALALLLAACAAASQPTLPSREPGLSGASSGVGGVGGSRGGGGGAALAQPAEIFPAGALGYASFRNPLLLPLPGRLVAFAAGRAPGGHDTSGRAIVKRHSTDGDRRSPFQPPRQPLCPLRRA